MSTFDYYITARGVVERGLFYNYLHELGYKDYIYAKEEMINSLYPFAVCIKRKELVIIESAMMCYLNDKAGRVKTPEEFKEIIDRMKK